MTRRPVPRALRRATHHDAPTAQHDAPPVAEQVAVEPTPLRPSPRPRPRPTPIAEPAESAEPAEPAEPLEPAEPFEPELTAVPDFAEPSFSWRVAALAVAVTLLTVAGGWLFWLDHQAAGADDARRDGLAASITAAETILSYDHRRIDADIAAATKLTTGQFRKDYADTSKTVAPVAKEYKAVVKATVKASSVVSAEQGRVVTLLFVDQATQSTRVQGTKVDQARVRITMVETGAGWRAEKIEAL